MNDLRAELVVFIDHQRKLFDFSVAYVRDGGMANTGWESGGIFPNTHDAIEAGSERLKEAKRNGFKRGATGLPWRRAAA